MKMQKLYMDITSHPWVMVTPKVLIICGVWGLGGKGRSSSLTHIHLDYVILEFLSCIKEKKNCIWTAMVEDLNR